MSGDVQPKKRKDKKRRKDDEPVPIQTHFPIFTNNLENEDVNIHVHKDHGTGGGICAKLVFFVLLSALAVLIGMIITEHRGLTDLESADAESKFSQLFDGWLDAGSNSHDDHDSKDGLDDRDEDHDHEEEDISAEDEDHQHSEENDEHGHSEEDEERDHSEENEEHEPSEEDEEQQPSEEEHSDEEVEEEAVEGENESVEEYDEDNEDEDNNSEVDEATYSEEENVKVRESDEEVISKEVEESREESDETKDEEQAFDEEEDADDDNDSDADGDAKENEVDEDEMVDERDSNEDETVESNERLDNVPAEKEDKSESKVGEEKATAKTLNKRDTSAESDRGVNPEESSRMAVKIGVGVAILVVAYLVLIRKWRTAPGDLPFTEEENMPTPDLSRRNTIIVPPTYQEVEQDIEDDEEDYSDEEENEYDKQQSEQNSAKWRYQELRSTYSRTLTPDSENETQTHPKSNEGDYELHDDEEVDEEEELSEEEEEEDYEIEDEYDEDEDEELLKRLEAKYFNVHRDSAEEAKETSWKRINRHQDEVEDSDSERQSDDVEYEHMNISNKDDFRIRQEIDDAQKSVENNPNYAIRLFDNILQKFPSSPRSLYGKALALDHLADQKRSNSILEQALKVYMKLLKTKNVPDPLFKMAAERCLNRMRFIGQYPSAILVHKLVIDRFPDVPKHLNDMAITYLTINRIDDARSILKRVLAKSPNDGVALVHYGFILKTADNNLKSAVTYLNRGIRTRDQGVIDGRFFFHLGDALARLGRTEEAMKVYEEGTQHKVFLSKYQRSLYNVPSLTGKPWWQPEDLPYPNSFKLLKQNWKKMRAEALSILNVQGYFQDESENLKDTGDWKQFELYARGRKNEKNCQKCPFTCSIIDQIPEARSCKRGQTKFSVMHPGTHVWPHCGPTNCRLRMHLGLKVPSETYIRVASETRSWKEGEILIFDDSFEHEVWHNGTQLRLVLIVDIWHPELTPSEKKNLSPI